MSFYHTPKLTKEGVENGVPYRIVECRITGAQYVCRDFELLRKQQESRMRQSLQATDQSGGRLSRAYHKKRVARRERGYVTGKPHRRP